MRRMKVVMEEKERYVKYDPDNDDIITRIIYDTIEKKPIIVTADRCIDLLNQQDKENQQLKALLKATEVTDIHNELADLQINNEWLESENQQLKKQLEEKEKEINELKESSDKEKINNYPIKLNIKPYIFTAKYECWSIRQTEGKHKYLILVEEEGQLKPAGSYSTKSKRLLMYNVKYTPPLNILEKIVTSCELFERM